MSLGAIHVHATGVPRGIAQQSLALGLRDIMRASGHAGIQALLDRDDIVLRVFVQPWRVRHADDGIHFVAGRSRGVEPRIRRYAARGGKLTLPVHLFLHAFDGSDEWVVDTIIHELRHVVDFVAWADLARRNNGKRHTEDDDAFREWLRMLAYLRSAAPERNANAAAARATMRLTASELRRLADPFNAILSRR